VRAPSDNSWRGSLRFCIVIRDDPERRRARSAQYRFPWLFDDRRRKIHCSNHPSQRWFGSQKFGFRAPMLPLVYFSVAGYICKPVKVGDLRGHCSGGSACHLHERSPNSLGPDTCTEALLRYMIVSECSVRLVYDSGVNLPLKREVRDAATTNAADDA
jgi:hypothetical protein